MFGQIPMVGRSVSRRISPLLVVTSGIGLTAKTMPWFAHLLRWFSKFRFRLLGLATIKDIPTEQFNDILLSLIEEQWIKIYEYTGFDAWVDYGCIKLRKDGQRLKFEWDNWTEGSIEGSPQVLGKIASDNNLQMINEWRWSEHDDN